MAREKNYKVIGSEIHAVILKLTERETKEVKKYLDLGFKLVVVEPVVKSKEEKAAEQKANTGKHTKQDTMSRQEQTECRRIKRLVKLKRLQMNQSS